MAPIKCHISSSGQHSPCTFTTMFQMKRNNLIWISWLNILYVVITLAVFVPSITDCKRISSSVGSSLKLQCPPCEQLHCSPKKPNKLDCKGGTTTGICNCCPVCAKVEGERCGGENNYLGKCDRGLVCLAENHIANTRSHKSKKRSKYDKLTAINFIIRPEGICRPDKTFQGFVNDGYINDVPFSMCKPKCTPEYCTKNPRAICSATESADNKQDCQGDCQHTACRACRFVDENQSCGKCNTDDFSCMKDFGQCMRAKTCSRYGFPCKKPRNKKELFPENASFKCAVPDCV